MEAHTPTVTRRLSLLFAFLCLAAACAPAAAAAQEPVPHVDTVKDVDPVIAGVARAHLSSVTAASVRRSGLASEWCGPDRADDDTVNAAHGNLATVKVVYAQPAGGPDRFQT